MTMRSEPTDPVLGTIIADGYDAPLGTLSDEELQKLKEAIASNSVDTLFHRPPYVPIDPARPWLDPTVQICVRRFLREVVLPKWTKNHPHKPCGSIRVDDWGRLLCRYVNPVNGVDGPWQNPFHFVFYAYNTFGAFVEYGTTLNAFLTGFCDIVLP